LISYAGITARASTSSAQTAANAVISKSSNYSTDSTAATYPITLSALTGATSDKSYALANVTYDGLSAKPTAPSYVQFQACGTTGTTTAPTTYSGGTGVTANPTGVKVLYWDYVNSNANSYYTAGVTSGNAGPTNTYPVGCFASGS
jgi:hypothetical protein